MKKWFLIGCLVVACQSQTDYTVSKHLTPAEQEKVMDKIIRYLAKPPEGLTFEERFYPAYNDYYQEQKSRHKLEAYYIENETHFFLISRPAPSLIEKRVATGGKVSFIDGKEIKEYEEVFRTWKMIPDTLRKRSMILFDEMVKGKSLEPYLTRNSNGVEYIEFPDDVTYFDKSKRSWITRPIGQ